MRKVIIVANAICVGWILAEMVSNEFSWVTVFVFALNIFSAALNMSNP